MSARFPGSHRGLPGSPCPPRTPSGGGPGAGGIQVLGSQNPRGFGNRQVAMPGGIIPWRAWGLLPRTSTLRCPVPRWPLQGAPHPWDVAKHPWVSGGSGRAGHTLHCARRGWILPQGWCVHVCACTCACTCECTCACTLCQRLPPARSRAGWDPAGAAIPHWVHWGRRALCWAQGRGSCLGWGQDVASGAAQRRGALGAWPCWAELGQGTGLNRGAACHAGGTLHPVLG